MATRKLFEHRRRLMVLSIDHRIPRYYRLNDVPDRYQRLLTAQRAPDGFLIHVRVTLALVTTHNRNRLRILEFVPPAGVIIDLDPLDLLRALAGVANVGLGPDGERAAKNLVDILIAGVRTRGVSRHGRRAIRPPE